MDVHIRRVEMRNRQGTEEECMETDELHLLSVAMLKITEDGRIDKEKN